MDSHQRVADTDMPQLFQAADAASLDGQRRYVNGVRIRLVAIVAAALLGLQSWRVGASGIDLLAIAGVVCFVIALLVEAKLWSERPDRSWYDGRAVAESLKTLAWKFAVCAQPFPRSMTNPEATRTLVEKSNTIQAQFRGLELAPIDAKMISEWMYMQRSASWKDRKDAYLHSRLLDQKRWYAQKATYNKKMSNRWRAALVSLEVAGVVGALVEALTETDLILGATIAAVVGAVVAWLETKQHDALARAYSAAVSDLAKAEAKLSVATSEEDWSIEVNDAEDAISREHTVWLASRSQA